MNSILLSLALLIATISSLCSQSLPQREIDPIPTQVETMYQKGLSFLAKEQENNGSWPDRYGGEPGVVGLCILAFLAHGEDPNQGPYANHIASAVNFILSAQSSSNGYIGNSMYNHGFATLALAEAYGMVNDPRLAPALSQAVDLIISAQKRNKKGGWRYTPDSHDADSTVSGCQIVALLAARNAGIAVPDEAIKKGLDYMRFCRTQKGSYGYTSASGEKPTLTAIGVTAFALAKMKEEKGFASSIEYLRDNLTYRDRYYPYYYEYYMSQALFHGDPELWEEWNAKNIRYLAASQSRNGSWPDSKGAHFATAGALLSMALNYRFLPIYEK